MNNFRPDHIENDLANFSQQERFSATSSDDSSDSSAERGAFNYYQAHQQRATKPGAKKFTSLKKFGPIGLVLALLGGTFAIFSSVMTPAIAINHFATAIDNRFNVQNLFMNQRTNQVLLTKFNPELSDKNATYDNDLVEHHHNTLKNVSDDLKQRMNEAGLSADELKTKTTQDYFQDANLRQLMDLSTKAERGAMNDLTNYLLRKATKSLNTRIKTNLIKAQSGKSFKKQQASVDDSMRESLNRSIAGETNGRGRAKKAKLPKSSLSRNLLNQADELSESLYDTAQASKASKIPATAVTKPALAVNLLGKLENLFNAADNVCQVYQVLAVTNAINKITNAMQLMRFALVFLNTADSIKAGTATEEEIAFIGNRLLALVPQADNRLHSGMDSAAFLLASQGTLARAITPEKDPSAAQFQNGADGLVAEVFRAARDQAGAGGFCEVITSGEAKTTQLVFNIALAIGSVVLTIASGGAAGAGASLIFSQLIKSFALGAAKALAISFGASYVIKRVAEYGARELTASMTGYKVSDQTMGEDFGNAVGAGAGAYHSQLAANRGAGLLTKEQAVAYHQANAELIALKAADERRHKSPFDASSPHTLLGSIIFKLWPYRSQVGTTLGQISAVIDLSRQALRRILPSQTALASANDLAIYSQCQDPDYTSNELSNAAFDIFCNPVRGIPSSVLFTKQEAISLRLTSPRTLVADTKSNTNTTGFVGEWFTPSLVLKFMNSYAKQASGGKNFFSPNLAEQDKNDNMSIYHRNCVRRGLAPLGPSFTESKNKKHNNSIRGLLGKTSDDNLPNSPGDRCLIDNNLLNPGANLKNWSYDSYSEAGQRAMFALFFTDRDAQCILDGGKSCQVQITPDSDGGNGGGGGRVWPLLRSNTVLRQFQAGEFNGIDISGQPGDLVVATTKGTVQAVENSSNKVRIVVRAEQTGREDIYLFPGKATAQVGDPVSNRTQLGVLDKVRNPVDQRRPDFQAIAFDNVGTKLNINPATPTTSKPSVLYFQINLNGQAVNPMKYLRPKTGRASYSLPVSALSNYQLFVDIEHAKTVLATIRHNLAYQAAHPKKDIKGIPYTSRCLHFSWNHAAALVGKINLNQVTPENGANGEGSKYIDNQVTAPASIDGQVDDRTKSALLKELYKKFAAARKAGKPRVCIIKVSGTDLSNANPDAQRHYMTALGFRKGISSAEDLKETDLITIDSWDGVLKTLGTSGTRSLFAEKNSAGEFFWAFECTK